MNTFKLFDICDVSVLKDIVLNDNENIFMQMFFILYERKQDILEITDIFTSEDLWYSQYYWCLKGEKESDNDKDKNDILEGMHQTIKYMDCYIDIDYEILQSIHDEVAQL